MTTIAYKQGIMASDSGAWAGNAHSNWARKIAIGPDGTLYGTAGNAAECRAFLDWVWSGAKGDHPKPREMDDDCRSSFIVLVAKHGQPIELITAFGSEAHHEAPYFAIGAGAVGALCAMRVGASACEAIQAAIAHADGASGPVRYLTEGAPFHTVPLTWRTIAERPFDSETRITTVSGGAPSQTQGRSA